MCTASSPPKKKKAGSSGSALACGQAGGKQSAGKRGIRSAMVTSSDRAVAADTRRCAAVRLTHHQNVAHQHLGAAWRQGQSGGAGSQGTVGGSAERWGQQVGRAAGSRRTAGKRPRGHSETSLSTLFCQEHEEERACMGGGAGVTHGALLPSPKSARWQRGQRPPQENSAATSSSHR